MKVGAILRACRARAGLSQEELADKLYINQSDVSKYENDSREPTLSLATAWVNATNAPEVLVAFMYGVDGLSIIQQIIDTGATIGTILFGGLL